ncbi:MAG TPA: methionine--tRNA ligase [candidate division Zixibacteria bacterium]|nr:methionine--tRNA ligase [candidate division Zixibacteria bacterium]
MDTIYITTPLYYVNAEPHLGSAYTMIVTDTLARYSRANGVETFYLTGTDEHGDKIAQAAAQAGLDPKTFTDHVSASFRAAWDACGFSYDHFIRTTDDYHVRYVQEFLTRVHEAGDIYFDRYSGLYCVGCERFYTEKELVGGKCPDHLVEPRLIEEENYFFRMSKYQDRLLEHIEQNPDFIRPEGFRNEVMAMLREPIGDLCISRPKARLTWGIEIPFDQRYVTYVWFDALINYVSALKVRGEAFFERFWPSAEHFIGKDILKPHGVFWPTMLMAAGLPLFRRLNVHGFWTSEGQKMSKSLGNTVSPLEMKRTIGMDAFRYFVLRESVFGQDADFRRENLVARYNADLANNLGNLVSRVLAMQARYFGGVVQPLENEWRSEDGDLERAFAHAESELRRHMAELQFHRALEAIWGAVDRTNRYIVQTAPFTLVKDPTQRARVGEILHHLAEALRRTARLIAPFMPDTARALFGLLRLDEADPAAKAPWGRCFKPGHRLEPAKNLFPRIESVKL